MRGAGNLAQVAQQLHVCRKMAEMIVADQAAERFAAELTELILVDLLEQRALVPPRVRIKPKIPVQLVLRDVHDPDLEIGVGLRVEDQIVQAAPCALDLLELLRMQNFVHLRGELLIEPRDHLLDGVEDVVLDDGAVLEGFANQSRNRIVDLGRGPFGAGLEALLQQRRKLVGCDRFGLCRSFVALSLFCHDLGSCLTSLMSLFDSACWLPVLEARTSTADRSEAS